MSHSMNKALEAVGAMAVIDLPVVPWDPTPAMLAAAMKAAPVDEAAARAIYAAMLKAYGNAN